MRLHPHSEVTRSLERLLNQVLILSYIRDLSRDCKGSVSLEILCSSSGYIKIKDIIAL